MSGLSAFALGFSAVRAIRGRTWAAANVLFEPNAPVDVTAPLICVWSGLGRGAVEGGDLLNGSGFARLRFEFFLPPRVTAGGATFDAVANQALLFAALWRQVSVALLTDVTPWADLWRRLRLRITSIDEARDLFEADKGQKIPVNVVEMQVETLAEPAVGEPPDGVWADFVAAMRADTAEVAGLADLFAAEIQGSAEALPDWQVAMGLLGTNDRAIQAIGLGPIPLGEAASAAAAAQATLDDQTPGATDPSTTLVDGVSLPFEDPPGDTQAAAAPSVP